MNTASPDYKCYKCGRYIKQADGFTPALETKGENKGKHRHLKCPAGAFE